MELIRPTFRSVEIDPQTLRRLWALCNSAESEVSAFVEVEIKDQRLLVQPAIHVFEQECTWTHTDMDIKSLLIFQDEVLRSGRNSLNFRCWFHTHPNMDVFFSPTDENNIRHLNHSMPTLISAVFNRRGQTRWNVIHEGFEMEWTYQIPGKPPDKDELAEFTEIVQQKVKRRAWNEWWFSKEPDSTVEAWAEKSRLKNQDVPEEVCHFKSGGHVGCARYGHERRKTIK